MSLRPLIAGALVAVVAGCSVTTLVATPTPSATGPTAPPATNPTASPMSSVAISATYPDGLPMTVGNEHAWRPGDILAAKTLPAGELLVAAWDFGGLAHSCPVELPGESTFWCPDFEGLAEVRGGPSVITLAWQHVPIQQAPALVVRVTVEPPPACSSNPPGGCPGPMLDAVAVIWAGTPD